MAGTRQRLTPDDVGCWLLKSTLPPPALAPGWGAGEERVLRRCLRRSYRLSLMVPGQPCLLWVSGGNAGVHAVGELVTAPVLTDSVDQPTVEVVLRLLPRRVPRTVLAAHPAFAAAEVLRFGAGSNPSYLTPAELCAVRAALASPRTWQ